MLRADIPRTVVLTAGIVVGGFGCSAPPDWAAIAPPEVVASARAEQIPEDVELLRNGSFEEERSAGRVAHWAGQPAVGQSLDRAVKIDGSQSLRIDNPGFVESLALSQRVTSANGPLPALRRYRFTGYLKSEGIPQPAGFEVRTGKNLKSAYFSGMNDGVIWTQDWRQFTIDFTLSADSSCVLVLVRYEKPLLPNLPTGTLWIDGLSLRPLPDGA